MKHLNNLLLCQQTVQTILVIKDEYNIDIELVTDQWPTNVLQSHNKNNDSGFFPMHMESETDKKAPKFANPAAVIHNGFPLPPELT